jgi:hypothetical protein
MQPSSENNAPAPSNSQPVMDVKPPQPVASQQPMSTPPVPVVKQDEALAKPPEATAETVSDPRPKAENNEIAKPQTVKSPKTKSGLGHIIVAVILVVIVLAALAVLAYSKK